MDVAPLNMLLVEGDGEKIKTLAKGGWTVAPETFAPSPELPRPTLAAQAPVVSDQTKAKILGYFKANFDKLQWDNKLPIGTRFVRISLVNIGIGYSFDALITVGAFAPNAPVQDPNQAGYFIVARSGMDDPEVYSNAIVDRSFDTRQAKTDNEASNSKIDANLKKQLENLAPGQTTAAILMISLPQLTYPPQMSRRDRIKMQKEIFQEHAEPVLAAIKALNVQFIDKIENLGTILIQVDKAQAEALAALPSVESLVGNMIFTTQVEKPSLDALKAAQKKYLGQLFAIPGVNGVSIGDGCIHVYFESQATYDNASKAGQLLPTLDGVPVKYIMCGVAQAQQFKTSIVTVTLTVPSALLVFGKELAAIAIKHISRTM